MENLIKEKNNNKRINDDRLGNVKGNEIDEDKLLCSSQETVVDGGSARHSTPERPTTSLASSASHSRGKTTERKIRAKSEGTVRKKQYLKAKHILGKIADNMAKGRVDARDAEDKAKYEKVVEEYLRTGSEQRLEREVAAKRNRSQNETIVAAKRKKVDSPGQQFRPYNEIVKDLLHVTIIDEVTKSPKPVMELWHEIEVSLTQKVMEYLAKDSKNVPAFDSEEILRGHRIIKCNDQFSLDFLRECVTNLCDRWKGVKLLLIPASEIPRKPRARIWLPAMQLESDALLRMLQGQNPNVPMADWVVIRKEPPRNNSMTFLLAISEESLNPLEKLENKLRFGVRNAKLKIFKPTAADDEVNAIEVAGKLLEGLSMGVPPNGEKDGRSAD